MKTKSYRPKIGELNLQYHVICDYKVFRPCQNGSNCCDNDYCRCSKLYAAKVSHTPDLASLVKDFKPASALIAYCLERILTIAQIWDKERYVIEIRNGYYGEEIGGVFFSDASWVDDTLKMFYGLRSDRARIEFILGMEYGYV